MASRALIIANSAYDDDHFAGLPAATADAAALAEVLRTPDIGGFSVQALVDVPQRPAMRALEAFFAQASRDDLLLLHLSLHGWKDTRGRLHFVMRDTELDYLGSTAISAEVVGDWMGHSRSRRIVVLLDCCYSGAFPMNALRRDASPPTVDVAEPLAGKGRVVLTASTALQYAYEGEQDVRYSRTPAQPSVFTSAVVRGLRDGSADLDGDGLISVHELYDYVHEEVRRRIASQTPTLSLDSAQGTIYLARSPRHSDVDRLSEMRAAVLDSQAWKRIGALHLIEQLLASVREPTRDAAQAALLGLIADEDPEVARRARDLWHGRGLGEIPRARAPRPPRPTAPPQAAPGGPIVGIDFGTTNSAIGVFLPGEDVRLIPNVEGALTTPSVVAITAEGEILVGTAAKRQALSNPAYTVRSAKLRLGTGWSIKRNSVSLSAEDVAEHILRRLREDAETYLGGPLRGAVLTVPANFGHDQRAALVQAGARAGLNIIRMINEPAAAAITYGLNKTDSTVLIFDLGGGTLDVSLIQVEGLGDEAVVEVRATAGDNHLGGDDWHHRIVQYLVRRVRDRYGLDLTDDIPAIQRLLEAAEAAKVELSSAQTVTIRLPYLAVTSNLQLHLEETLTRTEFETLTQDRLERCGRLVQRVIRDGGATLSEIDHVVLTGGATRMPAVGKLVHRLTGRQPYRGLIPEGVVTGAALQAGILSGYLKDMLLLDATPTSIGIELDGGTVERLVERYTSIPTQGSSIFTTSTDYQSTMVVHLVEGEEATASENKTLAVLEVRQLPATPRGVVQVEVRVDCDANGIWSLQAKDLGTGKQTSLTVDHTAMERATALVSSSQWTDIRRFAPKPLSPHPPPLRPKN
ncbi:Hsp70 family protein [Streptomyces sp. AC495_CC817]|uniref:caspase, EACC1-associated type n=1 Tax=Streptomyces sp. AC495_CC817 TaxID=2823900 RepID=UPI001C25E2B5|nr:Hsp70 family protein [Streptomyces sp. AC495_CC817]